MNRLVLLVLASLLLIAVAKAAPTQTVPEGTALLQVRDDDVTSTEEEGGDEESSGDSVSIDSPVNKLMQQALTGQALTLDNGQPANTGTGPTIALGNKNTIIKETDGSGDEDGAGEQKIKKTQEASKKSAQEQLQKLSEEEANKEKAVLQEKERLEEKNKRSDDELHRKDEQHTKTSREEMAKANEGTTKQLESVQREHERIVAKNQRDEQLLKEKSRAAEAEEKKRSELSRKKAAEDIEKKNKDHAEVLQKATAAAEAATKKAEAAAKENTQKAEATEKKAEQDKKAEETAKKNAIGNWCDCQSTRANFQSYGLWIQCPGDYLVTGIYRDHTNYLHGIYYFQCCRPCRPSNNQRLGLYNCQSANWWGSFDSQGWSYCPDNTYLQGVWKNSCDWIYCIEWAYCCGINGSRGRRECGTKDWSSSLDRAGWSTLDKNRFIQALYRSSSHYLSNIEHAQQCTWWPT